MVLIANATVIGSLVPGVQPLGRADNTVTQSACYLLHQGDYWGLGLILQLLLASL